MKDSNSIRPNVQPELLSALRSPDDLRSMSLGDRKRLALEIRTVLCNLSEKRSVHFASNLGVVELTIALHSVFDFSRDRLVWDVGHQCYPHKLLTGRFKEFETIRTKGGLSGYPNPAESVYDLFMTGHAGCSVGTVLGLACGDSLLNKSGFQGDLFPNDFSDSEKEDNTSPRYSVAVVGDGAFSSGPIFEALNHAGGLQQKMLVILNDNKISICQRVGGLGRYLDQIRMTPSYWGLKAFVRGWVEKIPNAYSVVSRFKDGLKAGLSGGAFFEDFGFQYVGPIDGHDLSVLCKYLESFKTAKKPVLLHILTEKGRGFSPAEDDPTKFHSTSPNKILDLERSGYLKGSKDSQQSRCRRDNKGLVRRSSSVVGTSRVGSDEGGSGCDRVDSPSRENKVVNPETAPFTYWAQEAVYKALRENPRVCVIVAAMTQGNMLEKARADFPDRFFDVGICEAHAVNFAAGLAKAGMRPIVVIYSGFLQRAYDHLFQEVSLQDLPIVFALDRAGLVGPDGATHHGVFDLSYLRPFPNFAVIAPGDSSDVGKAFEFACKCRHPVAIRYPKTTTERIVRPDCPYELGKSEVIRNGKDGVIAVCGGGFLKTVIELTERIERGEAPNCQPLDIGVVNVRFIKPLDTNVILQPLREGKPLVTLEENMLSGGFGSAVLEAANEEGVDARSLVRLGVHDRYIEHGTRDEVLTAAGLNVEDILRAFSKAGERVRRFRQ